MLLGRIGLGELNRDELMTGMIVTVVLGLAIIAFSIFRRSRSSVDMARFWYDKFCNNLARSGVRRYAHG